MKRGEDVLENSSMERLADKLGIGIGWTVETLGQKRYIDVNKTKYTVVPLSSENEALEFSQIDSEIYKRCDVEFSTH